MSETHASPTRVFRQVFGDAFTIASRASHFRFEKTRTATSSAIVETTMTHRTDVFGFRVDESGSDACVTHDEDIFERFRGD